MHFEAINNTSNRIASNDNNADLYFKRSLEFAMVQDFNSSIEDLNKALAIRPDFTIAYFCRANIRYKLVEYNKSIVVENENFKFENSTDRSKRISNENKYKFEVEMIMRDLDKVIEQQSSFAFAYFNKANILCVQQDYKTAITHYSKAIECDNDFAEAYFNRGLTYLFTGQDKLGVADLSKAGELGIYQAYNLIQRFNK
jgi:tetratricopeptide (TPR) repeat protein